MTFGAMVSAERPTLMRFARSLTRNDADRAEDLVQETMLRALANEARFAPGTKLQGWLITILRNHFFSQTRKAGREVADDGAWGEAMAGKTDLEASLISKDIISFLVDLPADHRRVLLMAADGLTYAEMAAELGVPEGTAKSRLSRARRALEELTGFSYA